MNTPTIVGSTEELGNALNATRTDYNNQATAQNQMLHKDLQQQVAVTANSIQDKVATLQEAKQQKIDNLAGNGYTKSLLESLPDADTLDIVGQSKDTRVLGYDAYEVNHGAAYNQKYLVDTPSGAAKLARQKEVYAQTYGVPLENVTNEDIFRSGMEQRYDALGLLNRQNKDLISTTMNPNGTGNIFGDKQHPLNIPVYQKTASVDKYGRPLANVTTEDGYTMSGVFHNKVDDTDYARSNGEAYNRYNDVLTRLDSNKATESLPQTLTDNTLTRTAREAVGGVLRIASDISNAPKTLYKTLGGDYLEPNSAFAKEYPTYTAAVKGIIDVMGRGGDYIDALNNEVKGDQKNIDNFQKDIGKAFDQKNYFTGMISAVANNPSGAIEMAGSMYGLSKALSEKGIAKVPAIVASFKQNVDQSYQVFKDTYHREPTDKERGAMLALDALAVVPDVVGAEYLFGKKDIGANLKNKLFGSIDSISKELPLPMVKYIASKSAKIATTMAVEGTTEAVQQGLQDFGGVQSISGMMSPNILKDIYTAGATGAMTAHAMHGVGVAHEVGNQLIDNRKEIIEGLKSIVNPSRELPELNKQFEDTSSHTKDITLDDKVDLSNLKDQLFKSAVVDPEGQTPLGANIKNIAQDFTHNNKDSLNVLGSDHTAEEKLSHIKELVAAATMSTPIENTGKKQLISDIVNKTGIEADQIEAAIDQGIEIGSALNTLKNSSGKSTSQVQEEVTSDATKYYNEAKLAMQTNNSDLLEKSLGNLERFLGYQKEKMASIDSAEQDVRDTINSKVQEVINNKISGGTSEGLVKPQETNNEISDQTKNEIARQVLTQLSRNNSNKTVATFGDKAQGSFEVHEAHVASKMLHEMDNGKSEDYKPGGYKAIGNVRSEVKALESLYKDLGGEKNSTPKEELNLDESVHQEGIKNTKNSIIENNIKEYEEGRKHGEHFAKSDSKMHDGYVNKIVSNKLEAKVSLDKILTYIEGLNEGRQKVGKEPLKLNEANNKTINELLGVPKETEKPKATYKGYNTTKTHEVDDNGKLVKVVSDVLIGKKENTPEEAEFHSNNSKTIEAVANGMRDAKDGKDSKVVEVKSNEDKAYKQAYDRTKKIEVVKKDKAKKATKKETTSEEVKEDTDTITVEELLNNEQGIEVEAVVNGLNTIKDKLKDSKEATTAFNKVISKLNEFKDCR